MGLKDLLGDKPQRNKNKKRKALYLNLPVEDREKLDNIVWLKKYIINKKEVSLTDVIKEAIDLVGEQIDYDALMKKHAKDIK